MTSLVLTALPSAIESMAKKSATTTQVTSVNKAKGTGKFGANIIRAVAGRSGWICNNPSCRTLTIGAAEKGTELATKVGEAAHIKGEKKTAARWENIDVKDIRHPSNAIWLCPSCHTMIDKNGGGEFTVEVLTAWKEDHEQMIVKLMLAHRSPLRTLRAATADGDLARNAVTKLSSKGAMFMDLDYEAGPAVLSSIEELRRYFEDLPAKVSADDSLKARFENLHGYFREYMNYTSQVQHWAPEHLLILRIHVGIFLQAMEDEYGCEVKGEIRRTMPTKG